MKYWNNELYKKPAQLWQNEFKEAVLWFQILLSSKGECGMPSIKVVFLTGHLFLGRDSSRPNNRAMAMQTDQILSW